MTKPRQAAEHERIEYKTLDGNWSPFVIGYCAYHKKYITERQARVHRCHAKHGGTCHRFQNMEGVYVRKMKNEIFYDRMIDRLDKMNVSLSKMAKVMEKVSKVIDTFEEIDREKSICKEMYCNMMDDGK